MAEEFSWSNSISRILAGESLSDDETAAAMSEIMEGAATPAQIAGFVVALRAKGRDDGRGRRTRSGHALLRPEGRDVR